MFEGSRKPPIELAKTGEPERVSIGVAGTEAGGGPGGKAEDAFAGSGLGGLADQAFAGRPSDGVSDFHGAGIEVDLVPEDGEGFADADAGGDHEPDEVG